MNECVYVVTSSISARVWPLRHAGLPDNTDYRLWQNKTFSLVKCIRHCV